MTELPLEERIRAWYGAEVGSAAAPASLVAAVERVPVTRSGRPQPRAARRDRGRMLLAAAAAVVALVVAGTLLPGWLGATGGPVAATPSPSADASPTPTAHPSSSPTPEPTPRAPGGSPEAGTVLPPGTHELRWPNGPSDSRLLVTVPSGWSASADGRRIFLTKGAGPWGPDDPGLPDLEVHDPQRIVPDVCASIDPSMVEAGPTADDLVSALEGQRGWPGRSGPTDVTVAGHPARKFVLTLPGRCPEPAEGVTAWANGDGTLFVPLEGRGGSATVYVVDVDGHRLALATTDHPETSTEADRAQRDAILASLRIERGAATGSTPPGDGSAVEVFPDGEFLAGQHTLRLGDTSLMFDMPVSGWSGYGGRYLTKDVTGTQGAEAVLFLTTYPGVQPYAATCPHLDWSGTELGPGVADTAASRLADRMASSPGADTVGPTDVRLGGRPAKLVELTVRQDLGCDPGYFFVWPVIWGGPLWATTEPGDTVTVWIIDTGGELVVVETVTTPEATPGLKDEIRRILDSFRFA